MVLAAKITSGKLSLTLLSEMIQVKLTLKAKFLSEMNQVKLAAKVMSGQWVAAILIRLDESVSNGQQDLRHFSRV